MELITNNVGKYFLNKSKNTKKGTIVFIHGFATTSQYHDVFVKYIEDEYDYIAIQLPGAGIQEWTKNRKPTVEDMVFYVSDMIKSLNLGEFFLIGHSMGGGIALRIANMFEKDVKALVLSTPMNSKIPFYRIFNYFKFNSKTFKGTFKLMNILYHDLAKTMNNDQEKIEEFVSDELKYQLENRKFAIKLKKSMFSLKNLKDCKLNESKISVPTLVIAGNYDKIIPPKSIYKAFGNNIGTRNANMLIRIELMSESAHIPFQEQEKEYAKEIIDFIKIVSR